MVEEQKIVKRRRRGYRPAESKIPRLRNSCPKCGSLNVEKRRVTRDYICRHCGWIGATISKIEY